MKKDRTKMKWNSLKAQALAVPALLMSSVAMAGPDLGEAQQQATNWHAIIMFAIFVGLTLLHYQMGSKTNHQYCRLLYCRWRYLRFPKWFSDCR